MKTTQSSFARAFMADILRLIENIVNSFYGYRFICNIHVQLSLFPGGISFRLKINEKFQHANATAIPCFHCHSIKNKNANQSVHKVQKLGNERS